MGCVTGAYLWVKVSYQVTCQVCQARDHVSVLLRQVFLHIGQGTRVGRVSKDYTLLL